jgi:hypothetical protein
LRAPARRGSCTAASLTGRCSATRLEPSHDSAGARRAVPRRRSWGSTLRGVAPARGCRGVCRPSDPPAVSPASRTDDRASPLGVTRNVCRFAGGLALLCGRWLPGDARHEQGYAKWRDCRRGLPPAAGSPAAAPGLRPRGRSVPGRAPPSDERPTPVSLVRTFSTRRRPADTAMGFCLSQVFVTGALPDSAPSSFARPRHVARQGSRAAAHVLPSCTDVHSPSPSAVGPRFQRPLTLVGFSVRQQT